ncbi:MAG: hypothetical protein LM575_07300, partial [Caldimicrobium sp.]|nr:hypothetical protein [Caldimicrobium sp.]
SGNLNIQSGGLLIGGTTVIDSSRNLTGINWVRQNLNFDIFRSANSYGIVWSGLTDSYKIYVNETAGSETTNLIIEYADNADSDNVIFRMVPHNAPAKNTLVLRYSDIIANATFRPLINNLIDLGTSSYQWANIYGVNIYASSSVRSAGGSASSPAFTFSSETNTGMYRVSNGTIGFSTGGTQRVTISSLGLNITYGGLQIGTYTVIDSSRNADFASLKIGGTNVIDSSRNIVNVNWVNATNIYASGTIYGNLGTIKKAVIYKFTTNGSLYIPANAYVFALLIGGGGGGGGGGDGFYDETRGTAWGGGGGGGGGGGAILYGYYYETSGQYISITVGNGGSGATTSGASGEAGGATKMTRGGVDIAIAGGGGGGKGGIGGAEGGYGGAGGIGGSTSSAPPFVVLLSIPGENGTPGEAGGINCGGRGGAGSNETIYQPVLFRPDGLFSLLPFSSEFLSFNSSALGGRGGSGACRLVAGGNGTNGSMPGAGGGGGGGGGASTLVPTEIGGSGGAGGAGGAGVAYIIVVT